MGARILVVEDESAIREMVVSSLERAGFSVQAAADAVEAERVLAEHHVDLVVLDWMLPGISGIELVQRLRRRPRAAALPVIMLTARSEEEDRLVGFEAGADDYVTKPFSPRELVARVRAVLRRSAPEAHDRRRELAGLSLDPVSHRVNAGAHGVRLGPTEFRLLRFFMDHPQRVFSRGQLLDGVWGRDAYIEERTVDVHIRRLRKALAAHGHDRLVQTVHGAGYRFSSDES